MIININLTECKNYSELIEGTTYTIRCQAIGAYRDSASSAGIDYTKQSGDPHYTFIDFLETNIKSSMFKEYEVNYYIIDAESVRHEYNVLRVDQNLLIPPEYPPENGYYRSLHYIKKQTSPSGQTEIITDDSVYLEKLYPDFSHYNGGWTAEAAYKTIYITSSSISSELQEFLRNNTLNQ